MPIDAITYRRIESELSYSAVEQLPKCLFVRAGLVQNRSTLASKRVMQCDTFLRARQVVSNDLIADFGPLVEEMIRHSVCENDRGLLKPAIRCVLSSINLPVSSIHYRLK